MHNQAMTTSGEQLVFRGGMWGSVIPLVVFLLFRLTLVIAGAPKEEGMIIGAMIRLSLGMLFVTNVAAYSECIFSLMANRTATVAVVGVADGDTITAREVLGASRPKDSEDAIRAAMTMLGLNMPSDNLVRVPMRDRK